MFRKFIEERYAADPTLVGNFALTAYRLVRVVHHAYRGYRRLSEAEAEVRVDGSPTSKNSTTRPSWKLIPPAMAEEFDAQGEAADMTAGPYCVLRRREADEREAAKAENRRPARRPNLFGAGVYMVDAGEYPRVRQLLRAAQAEWAAAADRWTTEEGYERFRAELKAHMGEADFARAEAKLPDRHALRAAFDLEVLPLPFQLSEETGRADPEAAAGRLAAAADLLEAVVRGPREDAASRWRALAGRLVAAGPGGAPAALRPTRTSKATGESVAGNRGVRGEELAVARRETDVFLARARRTVDGPLKDLVDRVVAELPAQAGAATAAAKALNADDTAALRVGKLLLAAAAAAEDEAGMCAGLSAALAAGPPP